MQKTLPHSFIIITGVSGAGKSLAMKCFEDQGYYCIDNLPPMLIPNFAQLCASSHITTVAAVVDVRGREFFNHLSTSLKGLAPNGFQPFILYLEAATDVLIRRYSESRRQHPLSNDGRVLTGLEREKQLLQDLRSQADLVLDTSSMSPHQLKGTIIQRFASIHAPQNTNVHLVSFGYKYGLPLDTDLVLDCRFLPNPYYVAELQPLSGLDKPVQDYVYGFPAVLEFAEKIVELIEFLRPQYLREGKSHLTVSFGCTGGHHRSVAITEHVAHRLQELGARVSVEHRDVNKVNSQKRQ